MNLQTQIDDILTRHNAKELPNIDAVDELGNLAEFYISVNEMRNAVKVAIMAFGGMGIIAKMEGEEDEAAECFKIAAMLILADTLGVTVDIPPFNPPPIVA